MLLKRGWRVGSLGLLLPLLFFNLTGCCLFNQPPIALIQASPTEGPPPLTVEFNGSGSTDPNGEIGQYSWDFGDGTSGSGMIITHTYSKGTFTATLTVRDRCGARDTDTVTIEVTGPNTAPVAQFTYSPTSPEVGETVGFNASGSHDPDGEIISYSWSFGDGNNGTGKSVNHIYQDAGTFAVILTVQDNDGATDQESKQIN